VLTLSNYDGSAALAKRIALGDGTTLDNIRSRDFDAVISLNSLIENIESLKKLPPP